MKVLITGGAGFIGSHLSEQLLKEGNDVTIIDDISTGSIDNIEHLKESPKFRFAIETIMNQVVMDRLISECDIIYHLAAAVGVNLIVGSPVRVIETNMMGTEIVLKIANRYKKKVILSSTSEIYGKSNSIPFKEDDDRIVGPTTKSRWSYSCSKALDEFLALAYHVERKLPVVIVRLFNTVGPRQTGRYGMVIPRFVQQALDGKPITVYGDGRQSRCFVHVKDVIKGVIKLANYPQAIGQIFNIGSTEEITINDLAIKIKTLANSKSEIQYIPYEKAYAIGFDDMRRRVPDLSRIRNLIGYVPKANLDSTLKEMIEYMSFKNQS